MLVSFIKENFDENAFKEKLYKLNTEIKNLKLKEYEGDVEVIDFFNEKS